MPGRYELISLVAMAKNRVIGHANQIPWHIPEDVRLFKEVTMGHAMIMGRKTYDSIGRPLPGRDSIVISRQKGLTIPGCQVAASVAEAVELAAKKHEKIFNIGGEQIFIAAMDLTDTIYLTELQREVAGEILFPPIPPEFSLESSRVLEAKEPLLFKIYRRKA
ncbi:MAG: dihydrofolate reductase [Thermodesulfobacteriota bacterium]